MQIWQPNTYKYFAGKQRNEQMGNITNSCKQHNVELRNEQRNTECEEILTYWEETVENRRQWPLTQ